MACADGQAYPSPFGMESWKAFLGRLDLTLEPLVGGSWD